jgi:hypothetical protein
MRDFETQHGYTVGFSVVGSPSKSSAAAPAQRIADGPYELGDVDDAVGGEAFCLTTYVETETFSPSLTWEKAGKGSFVD